MDEQKTSTMINVSIAIGTPPADYESIHESGILSYTDIRKLESVAVALIRIATYLESRHDSQGHKTAVKNSNATVKKVRRALGYTHTTDVNY